MQRISGLLLKWLQGYGKNKPNPLIEHLLRNQDEVSATTRKFIDAFDPQLCQILEERTKESRNPVCTYNALLCFCAAEIDLALDVICESGVSRERITRDTLEIFELLLKGLGELRDSKKNDTIN